MEIGKKAAEDFRNMYHEFRHEIDSFVLPILVKMTASGGLARLIIRGGRPAGFLLVEDGRIDGIYVRPEFRRMGLASEAVYGYIRENPGKEPEELMQTLRIVNTDRAAKRFWFSIFKMHKEGENEVDTLYRIDGLKDRMKDLVKKMTARQDIESGPEDNRSAIRGVGIGKGEGKETRPSLD